jgi:hypothetical protein
MHNVIIANNPVIKNVLIVFLFILFVRKYNISPEKNKINFIIFIFGAYLLFVFVRQAYIHHKWTYQAANHFHHENAVAGLYFAHHESSYFMIGQISGEQLNDYAMRRGKTTDKLRKLLIKNIR